LSKTPKWTSVAFPSEMLEDIRELIKELKYWPSVSTFCREAALEKIKKERELLKELRDERNSRDLRRPTVDQEERELLKKLRADREPKVEAC